MSRFALFAGGTGGHLFPAMALAQELRRRGHEIDLVTDHRVASYGQDFPARAIHIVPAATPSVSNPLKFAKAGFTIAGGIATAYGLLGQIKPDAVIGFGGYPTFPPMVAASLRKIPGVLHEQNAVLGRANKALLRFAKVLATSFPDVRGTDGIDNEVVLTGNPLRDAVRDVLDRPYPALMSNGAIRLVVFGGSQGARAFADLIPPAIAEMPEALRNRIVLVQQCRAEDMDRVTEAYRAARVSVELAPFFADLPQRMADAHLVIGRAGASTIAELTAIGRPSILIPLPGSLDADQKNNALFVERAGGGLMLEQATLSPHSLGTRLTELLSAPDTLAGMAQAARSLGQPDAVRKLADLAERLGVARAA